MYGVRRVRGNDRVRHERRCSGRGRIARTTNQSFSLGFTAVCADAPM